MVKFSLASLEVESERRERPKIKVVPIDVFGKLLKISDDDRKLTEEIEKVASRPVCGFLEQEWDMPKVADPVGSGKDEGDYCDAMDHSDLVDEMESFGIIPKDLFENEDQYDDFNAYVTAKVEAEESSVLEIMVAVIIEVGEDRLPEKRKEVLRILSEKNSEILKIELARKYHKKVDFTSMFVTLFR